MTFSELRCFARLTIALSVFAAIEPFPALAANSGLDTPTGVTSLPFSVQGVQVMTLYGNGLGIGRGQDGGWQLEVAGTGNQHGIFGQAGSAGYWGVGGWSNDGTAYGGLGVGNAYGAYGYSTNNVAVYGSSANNWSGFFYGAYGVAAASSTGNNWSGCFGSNCTGGTATQYGVYGNGTVYSVFGQSTNGYGVYGLTTGNNWSGVFGDYSNTPYGVLGQATNYGVYGQSPSGVGVYGSNNNGNNWGGQFVGGYGVYGQSTTGWAGQFYTTNSQNGVWIGNPSNNAQLCLNGQCVTSVKQVWAGDYIYGTNTFAGYSYRGCEQPNQLTGGCSCPGGTTSTSGLSGQAYRSQPWDETLQHVTCYYQ